MDIEAIKQLKHAYFRCIDTANWDELAVFCDGRENYLIHIPLLLSAKNNHSELFKLRRAK
ncbi:MAG: nuclear transport factor 2 family protein [Gemmatimonadetes bacterium]|nr:nuclear transport factor 2 family protein [Gemmatimonadota bacterium]